MKVSGEGGYGIIASHSFHCSVRPPLVVTLTHISSLVNEITEGGRVVAGAGILHPIVVREHLNATETKDNE
jgi:hypothetical protein